MSVVTESCYNLVWYKYTTSLLSTIYKQLIHLLSPFHINLITRRSYSGLLWGGRGVKPQTMFISRLTLDYLNNMCPSEFNNSEWFKSEGGGGVIIGHPYLFV